MGKLQAEIPRPPARFADLNARYKRFAQTTKGCQIRFESLMITTIFIYMRVCRSLKFYVTQIILNL